MAERSQTELPQTVSRLIADVEARTGQLRDLGTVRLLECADAALATRIAADRKTAKLCYRVGQQHLAVPAEHDAAFHTALRRLGYYPG